MKSSFLSLVAAVLIASVMLGPMPVTGEEPADASRPAFFLVARPAMPDPMFAQSVILILPARPQSPLVIGIMVNKPTQMRLADLFHQSPKFKSQSKHQAERAFFGGPVNPSEPLLLMRSDHSSNLMTRLAAGLYASEEVGSIAKILTDARSPQDVRLFLGRAQWSPGQLRSEILAGVWDAMPMEGDLLFAADPATVWPRLEKHAHVREVEGWSFAPSTDATTALFWR